LFGGTDHQTFFGLPKLPLAEVHGPPYTGLVSIIEHVRIVLSERTHPRQLGFDSRVLRIESAVFPNERRLCGTILGSQEPGREAAQPGMWKGHLGVVVGDEWLLDPTLDQANKPEWPRDAHVGPMAVQLNKKFWEQPWGSILVPALSPTGSPAKSRVRFSPHRRQVGFKNAGDARPSHWRELAERILAQLERRAA
jgi:hypothetical protein